MRNHLSASLVLSLLILFFAFPSQAIDFNRSLDWGFGRTGQICLEIFEFLAPGEPPTKVEIIVAKPVWDQFRKLSTTDPSKAAEQFAGAPPDTQLVLYKKLGTEDLDAMIRLWAALDKLPAWDGTKRDLHWRQTNILLSDNKFDAVKKAQLALAAQLTLTAETPLTYDLTLTLTPQQRDAIVERVGAKAIAHYEDYINYDKSRSAFRIGVLMAIPSLHKRAVELAAKEKTWTPACFGKNEWWKNKELLADALEFYRVIYPVHSLDSRYRLNALESFQKKINRIWEADPEAAQSFLKNCFENTKYDQTHLLNDLTYTLISGPERMNPNAYSAFVRALAEKSLELPTPSTSAWVNHGGTIYAHRDSLFEKNPELKKDLKEVLDKIVLRADGSIQKKPKRKFWWF